MKGKANLIFDFGNSDTRVTLKYHSGARQKRVKKKFILSNRFYNAQKDTVIPATYTPDKTNVISISGEYTGCYINGEMAIREYEKICIKPTAEIPKYSQTSALSFALGVVKAVEYIASVENIPAEDVDFEWAVLVLLPPKYCNGTGKKLMDTELRKITSVTNKYSVTKKEFRVDIKIASFDCCPEAFAAFVGCVYTEDGSIRAGYEKYAESNVLVTDIGAGTSDIVVVSDSEIIENTKETFPTGGNNVRSKLRRMIKEIYDYNRILDSQLETCIKTGEIKDGAKSIDCTEQVMSAKTEVAKSLVDDIQEYISSVDFSLRSVNALLAVGGGTLGGKSAEIKSISSIIVNFLKKFSSEIELIPMPKIKIKAGEEYVNEDGELITVNVDTIVELSARELNIEGAEILADL